MRQHIWILIVDPCRKPAFSKDKRDSKKVEGLPIVPRITQIFGSNLSNLLQIFLALSAYENPCNHGLP